MNNVNLIQAYQESFKVNFDLPALTNYSDNYTLSFGQLACEIDRLHRLFTLLKVEKGDRIALMGRDSVQWCTVFMATITYGAVIVPILQDFNIQDAISIINHSGASVLFMDDDLFSGVEDISSQMGEISCALTVASYQKLYLREALPEKELDALLSSSFVESSYPQGFGPSDIVYPQVDNDSVIILNYTSGTTGMSKGVMLTAQNMVGNVIYAHTLDLMYRAERILCFLPLAHAYSCAFNMLTPLTLGTHVYILGKVPSPKVLMKAFSQVKPTLIISVPLILEKIYKRSILPVLEKKNIQLLLKIPGLRQLVYRKINKKLCVGLGGNFRELIVGGAPISSEVAGFLQRIGFPLTVGYGMTECGPLISYEANKKWVLDSCGKALRVMEIRIQPIDTVQPHSKEIGEIQVRGMNVCKGYHNNPEANKALFTEDGWMHTGDLGYLDKDGNLFIKGRSKTMILGANGQNIYPEEIELKINNHPLIAESLVLSRKGRLVALILPNEQAISEANLTPEAGWSQIEEWRAQLNLQLGSYEKVTRFEEQKEPFVKTPKQSIKRFMYN
jgi:long-chain acyl-CoA synthetase